MTGIFIGKGELDADLGEDHIMVECLPSKECQGFPTTTTRREALNEFSLSASPSGLLASKTVKE